MNLNMSARGALVLLLAATASQALAQRVPRGDDRQAPKQQPASQQGQNAVSAQAAKAIQELQTAVNANDVANIPVKVAAAQAVAQTPFDRLVIGQLQLKAANAANNHAAAAAALEAMLATGAVPADKLSAIYTSLAKAQLELKQHDKAAATLERLIALQPSDLNAKLVLADVRKDQGRTADAIALIQSAIAARTAAGQKAEESWYKQAVALAYEKKLPNTLELSRQWLAAYPTSTAWRDTLRIYRQLASLDEAATLDLLRLARAAGGMGEQEYSQLAYHAITKGYPGEAKAVVEEGVAAGQVNRAKSPFKEILAEAQLKSAGEEASLDSAAKSGLAAGSAKAALTTGDLLYGYGRYARAAELYRAALGKPGADASLINLHLGMALARAGDKAGATAALNAVTGPRAELAKFWLAYLASRP